MPHRYGPEEFFSLPGRKASVSCLPQVSANNKIFQFFSLSSYVHLI